MQIAGIQKTTLVDYEGLVAATIFTRGCPFRCSFCHNPELVLPEQFLPLTKDEEVWEFLKSRVGKLDGICITGGEPTLQPDLGDFIAKVKNLGYKVKLDSNGYNSKKLIKLISEGNIDYLAMDIKGTYQKYVQTARPDLINTDQTDLIHNIQESVSSIMSSGIDYEFRTTIVHPFHEINDFHEIGKMIQGAPKYFLQNYVPSKQIGKGLKMNPFTQLELDQCKEIMQEYVTNVEIR